MISSFQERKFRRRTRNENPEVVVSKICADLYLKKVYQDILEYQLNETNGNHAQNLKILELGSAGGITKILRPEITTCDVRPSVGVDFVLGSDFKIPWLNSSADLVIAKDVLHHISNPIAHFDEVIRVLKTGSSMIYAEPNWNFLSRLIFKYVHPEPFDIKQKSWSFDSPDPMYSNQALPFIIFVRDHELFSSMYPSLQLRIHPHPFNGISFILSGGVMNRSFLSSSILLTINRFEKRFTFLNKMFGTLRFIQLTKIDV